MADRYFMNIELKNHYGYANRYLIIIFGVRQCHRFLY